MEFDKTENLFVEGDNLDALKLLQETYLGKIKMIYIDPPYNTGGDFIFVDDFAESTEKYLLNSGQKDKKGNRLVANKKKRGALSLQMVEYDVFAIKAGKEFSKRRWDYLYWH